jgi:hypothetical protein
MEATHAVELLRETGEDGLESSKIAHKLGVDEMCIGKSILILYSQAG